MLGFIVIKNEKMQSFLKQENEKGHIEIALRLIRMLGWQEKYQRSKWGKMNNPVDYLVFEEGAIKLGTRWEDRVITYCPNTIEKRIYPIIRDYSNRRYRLDEVYDPTLSPLMSFHKM